MTVSRSKMLITTPAEPRGCRCRALVLDGWAEGIHARVDPTALNRDGELAAILAGRQTFALTRDGLVERTTWRTRHPRGQVLAEHRCGLLVAPEHRAPPTPPARYVVPDQPPF